MRTLVWFRGKELRISDHAPLREAAAAGEVIPLFVLDPFFFAPKPARELPHRIQFLLESLVALAANLEAKGSRLVVVAGKSTELVPRLAAEWRVDKVVSQRWTEPFGRERDKRIAAKLTVPFELYEGETLFPPGRLRNGQGLPYAVFTPFARAFAANASIARPESAPQSLSPIPKLPKPLDEVPIPTCADLGIERNPNLLPGGERAGRERLRTFLADAAANYSDDRNRLDLPGTSRLSVDLKFGTVSPRQIWIAVEDTLPDNRARHSFLNELVWREFAYSTLWDRPELLEKPFRPEFEGFPWLTESAGWEAWVQGRTGYPVVDAAARQLLGEGFVHNRARMIAASFLTKHLLIDYRRGEAHYMKYLTDGDWASNNAGWQWTAGCGCDAQPYFRIFNPVTQGEKFDPAGDYIRRWLPELARLPAKHVHQPWEAPAEVLAEAGITLGKDYPRPIIDLRDGRERFLATAAAYLPARRAAKANATDNQWDS